MPDIFANEEEYVGVEPSAQPSENAQTSFANDDFLVKELQMVGEVLLIMKLMMLILMR